MIANMSRELPAHSGRMLFCQPRNVLAERYFRRSRSPKSRSTIQGGAPNTVVEVTYPTFQPGEFTMLNRKLSPEYGWIFCRMSFLSVGVRRIPNSPKRRHSSSDPTLRSATGTMTDRLPG